MEFSGYGVDGNLQGDTALYTIIVVCKFHLMLNSVSTSIINHVVAQYFLITLSLQDM